MASFHEFIFLDFITNGMKPSHSLSPSAYECVRVEYLVDVLYEIKDPSVTLRTIGMPVRYHAIS
jgi:hypothetical protein